MPAVEGPTRRDPTGLLIAAAVLLALRVGAGVLEAGHPPAAVDLVDWQPPAVADSLSRATDRPVFYDFTAEWCGPCLTMQREVFADRSAAQTINALFVPVRVTDRRREDGRNPPLVDSLQKRYGVESFPTLVVAPRERPPIVTSGYRGRQGTMTWLTRSAVAARTGAPLRPDGASRRR